MNPWSRFFLRRHCCECGRRDGQLIQWMAKPAQWVCLDCAWALAYPDWLAETFKAALPF